MARIVPSFDHNHSWIVLLVVAAILVILFAVLWLLLKSKHKKGTKLHDVIIIKFYLMLQKRTSVYVYNLLANSSYRMHTVVLPCSEGSLCRTTTYILCFKADVVSMLLLLSGDVETNPGPGK